MKKLKTPLAILLLLLMLVGCAGKPAESSEPEAPERVQAEAISFTEPELTLRDADKKTPAGLTVSPADADLSGLVWKSSDEKVVTVDAEGELTAVNAGEATVTAVLGELKAVLKVTVAQAAVEPAKPEAPVTPTGTEPYFAPAIRFDENDGCTYFGGVLIVNKSYPLPEDYDPGAILPEVMTAFNAMAAAAKKDGISLWICSGYRTYQFQKELYESYVARASKEEADTYSARPGHSEHETGLAFDINEISYSFGETPAGMWVKEHGPEYGFIIRYPKGKEAQTGYIYEPWHLRFLGTELATKVAASGLCLEEYFGIDSVYAD